MGTLVINSRCISAVVVLYQSLCPNSRIVKVRPGHLIGQGLSLGRMTNKCYQAWYLDRKYKFEFIRILNYTLCFFSLLISSPGSDFIY